MEIDKYYKWLFGETRTSINQRYLKKIPKDARILEIGCSRGIQLNHLQKMGFTNLWGLEINKKACTLASDNPKLKITQGNAINIPFPDESFDLVFTSGVLIHILPYQLQQAIREIVRVSKKYIWCLEYFENRMEMVKYRGIKNLLWKNNFKEKFILYHDLRVVKCEKLSYIHDDNIDEIFLLEKNP